MSQIRVKKEILLKVPGTTTIIPGEALETQVPTETYIDEVYEIEPRREATRDFLKHQLTKVAGDSVPIRNDSKKT